MRKHKYQAIFNGLSAVARKVLDATPISESWTSQQITSELRRIGQPKDFRLVEGCLNSLVKSGIVNEVQPGMFRRTEIHEPLSVDQRIKEVSTQTLAPPDDDEDEIQEAMTNTIHATKAVPKAASKKTTNTMETLIALSTKARSMAEDMRVLADEIDAAALAAEEQINTMNQNTSKLRTLQALLKDIGTGE